MDMRAHSKNDTATDPRWLRILARDRRADGTFWYTVSTTRIYCRPSCPSRAKKPENVGLHATLAEAKATGFRACRRCNPEGLSPDEVNSAIVARACHLIQQSEESPSIDELAVAADLSPGYFHRLFKKATGLTPRAYAAGLRAGRVREALLTSSSVTEAMYASGFSSSGRFYEQSANILGMTPTKYRTGGMNEELRFAIGQSSLGALLVASSEKGIAAIFMGDDANALVEELQDRFPKARLVGGDADYERLVARVVSLVEAPEIGLDLPLDVRGTAFQQRVWKALLEIPSGSTASYTEIAERIGSPRSVRAVAGACAANNISIVIPCHRVIRSDGSLSGYAWGVERKRRLLAAETRRDV